MKRCETKKEKRAKKAIALSEIFIIVCATVAFAFILSGSQSVSADIAPGDLTKATRQGKYINPDGSAAGTAYMVSGQWYNSDGKSLDSRLVSPIGQIDVTPAQIPQTPVSTSAPAASAPNTKPQTAPSSTPAPAGTTKSKLDLGGVGSVVGNLNLAKGNTGDDANKIASSERVKGAVSFNLKDSDGEIRNYVLKGDKTAAYQVGKTDSGQVTYGSYDYNTLITRIKEQGLNGKVSLGTDPRVLSDLGWGTRDKAISTDKGSIGSGGKLFTSPEGDKAYYYSDDETKPPREYSLQKGRNPDDTNAWKETGVVGEDLSKIAGKTAGGHLTEALTWAAGFAAIVQIIGATEIIDKNTANSLTVAGVGGIIVWKGLVAIDAARGKGPTFLSKWGGLIGLGVAALIFWLMYEKKETRLVKFECMPFEPPLGGSQCERCNKDPFRPCSEYRCKALGQACELLNPGTGKELCAWKSKFDVKSATIEAWKNVLYPYDLKYTPDTNLRPNAKGVKIVRGSNGCLQAFTPLVFGITTNEPTQCKIDYNHTSSYGEMQYLFGGENYYAYNHTQKMKLPTPEGSANDTETPELKNDGTYSLYVRCQDANGNQNVDEYSFSFCVDASEDTTPPLIEKASIISGSPVRYGVDSVPIEVYTNEPADCRWSRGDKPYQDMENSMSCASSAEQINNDLLYTCYGNLTGVKDKEDNKFFFRCKDNPGKEENKRNVMVQSWPSTSGFILKGSRPLIITNVAPNGTISGSTTTVTVNLQVETSSGAEEGKAICMFSPSGANGTYVNMYETDNYVSKQSLDLTSGAYRYSFRCNDAGGNFVENSTAFTVQVDKGAPLITRVYKEVPDALKVITNEDAECAYSLSTCNFEFKDGIKMIYSNPSIKNVHFAEWKPSAIYYVRCRDFYNNEPSSGACSLIVSAVKLTSEKVE